MSVLAFAPWAQPGVQCPRLMHGARPSVLGRRDRGVRWPPVPAKLVHRLGITRAGLAERQRRHRRTAGRIGRIAGEAGDAHHAVVLGKERLQRRVIDRPVIGDAVQRPHAKIRRVHPREMRREHDGAAADRVEVGDLHRRVVVVDRIVGRPPPPVRADVEIAVSPRFPVPPVAWEVGLLHPIALFQAQDLHARLGQAPGHRRTGRAGADDQDIDDLVGGHCHPLNRTGSPGAASCCRRCRAPAPGWCRSGSPRPR